MLAIILPGAVVARVLGTGVALLAYPYLGAVVVVLLCPPVTTPGTPWVIVAFVACVVDIGPGRRAAALVPAMNSLISRRR